jgi:ABC-type uncharacterized transport system substrate-binding protein
MSGTPTAVAQDAPPTDNSVVVLVPTSSSPEREVYGRIWDGIADTLREHHVRADERSTLNAPTTLAQAGGAPKESQPRAVISLGRAGYQIAAASDIRTPWIAGALQVQDADIQRARAPTAAVSLTPDPRTFLEALKQLAPKVTRVLVAYNPDRAGLYIDAARAAGTALKISLVTLPAHDLREASAHYYGILKYANPQTDALWLLEGEGLVDLDGTLPSMIETAWADRFLIVSNVPEYARRGVLLAAYPDPKALGRQLASLTLDATAGKRTERLQYGSDLVMVLNVRVASHLGLDTNTLKRSHQTVLVGEQ